MSYTLHRRDEIPRYLGTDSQAFNACLPTAEKRSIDLRSQVQQQHPSRNPDFRSPEFQCVLPCRLGPSKGSKPCLFLTKCGSIGPAEWLTKNDQLSLRIVVKPLRCDLCGRR